MDVSIEIPDDFADYEWEVTAKGWLTIAMIVSGRRYLLNFYDPVRLSQEIQSDLERGHPFLKPNLVVVETVTRTAIERAVHELVQSGRVAEMIEERPSAKAR
ncbi:hypothetical protein ACQR16_10505 [Bradyrhizobium oligotrophicum]|uniref:hypothetical protein n=1 Tax=Bradyrhizobium oligotrophicum TaxID=44255 RepID=UPI003EB9B62B